MDSLELACQLRSLALDVPPPPLQLDFDCSEFDAIPGRAPSSLASSFNSLSSARNAGNATGRGTCAGLVRTRCSHNLVSGGSTSSDGSMSAKRRRVSLSDSRQNESWGYFADTQH